MGYYKRPFTVYPRRIRRKDGTSKTVYYYRLRDDPKRIGRSTGQTRKGDALRWLEINVLGDEPARPSDTTLQNFALSAFDAYVEARAVRNNPLTPLYVQRRRRIIERHILRDPIAEKHFEAITLQDCENFETRIIRELRDKKSTAKLAVSAFVWLMRRAKNRGVIASDPAAGMDHYKIDQKQRTIYTETEINKLFPRDVWESGDFSPWQDAQGYIAYLLALCTGMRKGEILALRWKAVHLDFEPEYIEIDWQLDDQGNERRPKSRKVRVTPIFDFAFWKDRRAIKALHELQKSAPVEAKIRGIDGKPKPSGYVFAYKDGSPRLGTWWNDRRLAALERAGIDRYRGPDRLPLDAHSLRHTLASTLRASGMTDSMIRDFCGWSSVEIQTSYTHIAPDLFGRIMAQIGAVTRTAMR